MLLILLVACWCAGVSSVAQTLPDAVLQTEFKFRVKQLDEFMARFNGEESVDVDVVDSLKPALNLLYLFNREWFTAHTDSMKQVAEDFIGTVIDNRTKLHYDDEDWFAEVSCYCTYQGKPDSLTLFLKPEKLEEFQFRWVIVGAKGTLLKLNPGKRNHGLDIMPNDHEVAFRALSKVATLGSDNILNYAPYAYTPDALSVFYALVYAGALNIESTGRIVYHFCEVPGYVFRVERFNRKGNNTGWLISDVRPMSEIEKPFYYEQCLKEK